MEFFSHAPGLANWAQEMVAAAEGLPLNRGRIMLSPGTFSFLMLFMSYGSYLINQRSQLSLTFVLLPHSFNTEVGMQEERKESIWERTALAEHLLPP